MKTPLKLLNADSKGQALIVVLVLLVVGMIVITPFLSFTSALNKRVKVSEKDIYSFYASDAAVEYALYRLRFNEPPILFNGTLPGDVNGTVTAVTTVQDPAKPPSGTLYYYVVTTNSSISGTTYSQIEAKITCDRLFLPHSVAIDTWTVLR